MTLDLSFLGHELVDKFKLEKELVDGTIRICILTAILKNPIFLTSIRFEKY